MSRRALLDPWTTVMPAAEIMRVSSQRASSFTESLTSRTPFSLQEVVVALASSARYVTTVRSAVIARQDNHPGARRLGHGYGPKPRGTYWRELASGKC
jgi:hypothetical protein